MKQQHKPVRKKLVNAKEWDITGKSPCFYQQSCKSVTFSHDFLTPELLAVEVSEML